MTEIKCGTASWGQRVYDRGWRENRDRIFRAATTRKPFRGPKHSCYPDLEKRLSDFAWEWDGQFLFVSAETKLKAKELAQEANISRNTVEANRSSVQKFMHRAGFSLHRKTSICQKLPVDYEKKLVALLPALCHRPAEAPELPRRIGRK